jgi:UDP-galactopyranose mutase
MLVDYKHILFNIKNDKLSIFCILTHRYGKHIKSQSMKDLWTFVICHFLTLMS